MNTTKLYSIIYSFSKGYWHYYLLTFETGNLGNFTSSIVVHTCRIVRKRVPRSQARHKKDFFFTEVKSSVTIFINAICNPKIR